MKRSNTYTNNTSGNIDYSPFAPTDTLNTRFSDNVVGYGISSLSGFSGGPVSGAASIAVGMAAALTVDARQGTSSVSYSITGHDGDTFGHTEF